MINIKKRKPPRTVFKYTDRDIREIVRDDFFQLCYLCEEYVPIHFEIDHFFPQNNFPIKENDWDNLFYSCEKCNSIRPKDINTIGKRVLNNCVHNIENIISLKYNETTKRIDIKGNNRNLNTKNTIELLHKIYNGIGSNSPSHVYRQEEIESVIESFKEVLDKYKKSKIKNAFKQEIIERISKKTKSEKSAYVSFKRALIKEDTDLKNIERYFD